MLGEGHVHAKLCQPQHAFSTTKLAAPSGLRGQIPRPNNDNGVIAMHRGNCTGACNRASNHNDPSNNIIFKCHGLQGPGSKPSIVQVSNPYATTFNNAPAAKPQSHTRMLRAPKKRCARFAMRHSSRPAHAASLLCRFPVNQDVRNAVDRIGCEGTECWTQMPSNHHSSKSTLPFVRQTSFACWNGLTSLSLIKPPNA